MKYRCLSLWQPWATLAAMGVKKFETRGKDTKIRGTVLIHAAQNLKGIQSLNTMLPVEDAKLFKAVMPQLFQAGFAWKDIPLGAIVGAVNITATYKSEYLKKYFDIRRDPFGEYGMDFKPSMIPHLPYREDVEMAEAFGDYRPGRYGWKLEDCRLFKEPIPAKGSQGFFFWEGTLGEMEGFPLK